MKSYNNPWVNGFSKIWNITLVFQTDIIYPVKYLCISCFPNKRIIICKIKPINMAKLSIHTSKINKTIYDFYLFYYLFYVHAKAPVTWRVRYFNDFVIFNVNLKIKLLVLIINESVKECHKKIFKYYFILLFILSNKNQFSVQCK